MPTTGRCDHPPAALGQLVAAAARRFAATGYEATSVSQVAADAGLEPALAHRFLSSKEHLFTQVASTLIDPVKAQAVVAEGSPESAGERLLRYFLSLLAGADQPGLFLGLVRSAVASEDAASLLRQFLAERVHREIAMRLRAGSPELRVALVASQLAGIAIARHAIGLAPLTAADDDQLAGWIAPVLQHYLTGSPSGHPGAPATWHERFQLLLAEVIEDGNPSLAALARRLAVSPRTLQRQLAAHGTTWRAELDAARRYRAEQARNSGPLNLTSLARRLGYADPRSARRALRRWDDRPGAPSADQARHRQPHSRHQLGY